MGLGQVLGLCGTGGVDQIGQIMVLLRMGIYKKNNCTGMENTHMSSHSSSHKRLLRKTPTSLYDESSSAAEAAASNKC